MISSKKPGKKDDHDRRIYQYYKLFLSQFRLFHSKPPCRAAIGSFEVCHDLLIVDLSNLPEIPSIFDSGSHNEREMIYLLYDFVNEISKSVQKDGTEHIDYIPSQVVYEYFAKIFQDEDGKSVDGLAYKSAILPGGNNIVLFPPRQQQSNFADLVRFFVSPHRV